tara:strand:+ start:1514 stop:1993 length:480 start_codon:yes stop_codon:yes gene_type:complete
MEDQKDANFSNIISITDLQNEYSTFNTKLNFFTKLEDGDKIYNADDEIVIDKKSYYQGLMRLIRGDNKYCTMNYLYNMQNNYFKFLKDIIDFLNNNNNNINYEIEEFIVCVNDLNKVILNGLDVLTNTYIDFEDMINYKREMIKKFNLFNFSIKNFINK